MIMKYLSLKSATEHDIVRINKIYQPLIISEVDPHSKQKIQFISYVMIYHMPFVFIL